MVRICVITNSRIPEGYYWEGLVSSYDLWEVLPAGMLAGTAGVGGAGVEGRGGGGGGLL